MQIKLSKALIKRCIKALEFTAEDIAGRSQYPYKFEVELVQEWKDAQYLKKMYSASNYPIHKQGLTRSRG